MAAFTAVSLPPPTIPLTAGAVYAVGPPWTPNVYTAIKFGPGVRVRVWDTGTLQWITAPSA